MLHNSHLMPDLMVFLHLLIVLSFLNYHNIIFSLFHLFLYHWLNRLNHYFHSYLYQTGRRMILRTILRGLLSSHRLEVYIQYQEVYLFLHIYQNLRSSHYLLVTLIFYHVLQLLFNLLTCLR